MPTQVQFRRGNTAQVEAFTGANGEIVVDYEKKHIVLQDGVTQGGTVIPNTQALSNAYSNAVAFASNASNINTGTLSAARLPNTGVTANQYGNSSTVPVLTIDSTGRVTAANTVAVAGVSSFSYEAGNNTLSISTSDGNTYTAQVATVNSFNVTGNLSVTQDVTITGNLTVSGSATYVNTTIVEIKDKNITIAKGSANNQAADGSGITIDGANVGWYYDVSSNTWQSNVGITPSSNVAYNIGSSDKYWANVYVNKIVANGGFGSNGQALYSNGTGLYWATPLTGLTAGNTAISNGVSGGILFESGNVVSESSSLTFNPTNPALTVNGGTVTQSNPILDLVQTWNATANTFTGIRFNVTDTASAAASLLMDLQVGGVSKFKVDKAGNLTTAGVTLNFGTSGSYAVVQSGGVQYFQMYNSFFSATRPFSLSSDNDTILTRRGAANLRFGNADVAAPVAQTLSVQSVVAGTLNTAGANFTITGSQGTGTGAGGSIIFQVAPAGTTGTAQNALSTALTINSSKDITTTSYVDFGGSASTLAWLYDYGTLSVRLNSSGFRLGAATPLGWTQSNNSNDTLDVILRRDAAGTLALRNGTNAQIFRVYETTDGTNGSWLEFIATASTFKVRTNNSGVGVWRPLYLEGNGVYWNSGNLLAGSDNAYDIGAVAASRPRRLFLGGGSLTGTAADSSLEISPTWNTTGTPTAIKLNVTDTASNASSLLVDLQVGGVSQFKVNKAGRIYASLIGSSSSFGTDPAAIFFSGASAVHYISGGEVFRTTSTTVQLASFAALTWTDTILTRRGAANLRLGAADAAAPVAQTLSVQSVVAGTTNVAGADFTITGSQGTGTGTGGSIKFQVAPAGSTGTAQNALATVMTINSSRSISFPSNPTPSFARMLFGDKQVTDYSSYMLIGGVDPNTPWLVIEQNRINIPSIGFHNTSPRQSYAPDVILVRDAANTLALRNSTNAQAFRIYNTYTDASNYELGKIAWNANVLQIGTEKLGTGTARNVAFQVDGTTRMTLYSNALGLGTGVYLGFNIGSGIAQGTADGDIKLRNNMDTGFGLLQFGGTTSSFPALKRSSATLQARLADDSGYTNIEAAQVVTPTQTLTDAATITFNANISAVAEVTLTATGRTLTPSNLKAGASYLLFIKQDATGSRTITTWTNFKWPGGVAPTLSTAANAVDIISGVSDGTYIYAAIQQGFA